MADDGLFVGNIEVKLTNPNAIIANCETMGNMMHKQINTADQANKQYGENSKNVRHLVIFDRVSTLYIPTSSMSFSPSSHTTNHQLAILAPIFIKSAHTRTILYRSPFYIEHIHPSNTSLHCTHIN